MKTGGVWKLINSTINSTEYRLPIDTPEGSATVRCIASNSAGQNAKTVTFSVKKLPLPVIVDVGESPLNVKEQRHISCRTDPSDDDLKYLQLSFSTHEVSIRQHKDAKEVHIKTKNKPKWTKVSTFPHNTAGVTIHRPTSGQAIRVILTATPRHNGCTVTCVGESVPDKGKKGEQKKTIQVRWPPSLRKLSVHGPDNSHSPVTIYKLATIRCELQKGDPAREETASVTATVGGRDLGTPHRIHDLKEDGEGYKWKEAIWSHQFRRQDDWATVVCGLKGEKDKRRLIVDVQYAPTNLVIDPSRVGTGEAVHCTADGKPTPLVKMRLAVWEENASKRSAELMVGKELESGNYTVVCEAENIHGTEKQSAVVVIVAAAKQSDFFVHFKVSAVFNGVLLLVNILCVLFILCVLRRRSVSATSAAEMDRVQVPSTSHAAENEYVETTFNVAEELAQAISLRANSNEDSNIYENMAAPPPKSVGELAHTTSLNTKSNEDSDIYTSMAAPPPKSVGELAQTTSLNTDSNEDSDIYTKMTAPSPKSVGQ